MKMIVYKFSKIFQHIIQRIYSSPDKFSFNKTIINIYISYTYMIVKVKCVYKSWDVYISKCTHFEKIFCKCLWIVHVIQFSRNCFLLFKYDNRYIDYIKSIFYLCLFCNNAIQMSNTSKSCFVVIISIYTLL